jgi:hypothetical protein
MYVFACAHTYILLPTLVGTCYEVVWAVAHSTPCVQEHTHIYAMSRYWSFDECIHTQTCSYTCICAHTAHLKHTRTHTHTHKHTHASTARTHARMQTHTCTNILNKQECVHKLHSRFHLQAAATRCCLCRLRGYGRAETSNRPYLQALRMVETTSWCCDPEFS